MTKERLKAYAAIKAEQAQIRGLLEEVESRLYSAKVQQLTGMPAAASTGGGSAQERLADSTMQLRDRYRAKLAELDAEQLAIEDAIEGLRSAKMRQLLRCKYIEGMTWEQVCVAISYSWAQTHRLHSQALQQLRLLGE